MAERPKKMSLVCPCGFSSEDAQTFLDHMLSTQHLNLPVGAEGAGLAEVMTILGTIQQMGDPGFDPERLPEGMELRHLSEEDILSDDELTDEEKAQILQGLQQAK